jgi:type II secretory pathway component GspD/PulD (secretin)
MSDQSKKWKRALCLLLLTSLSTADLRADESEESYLAALTRNKMHTPVDEDEGYTINFNNVSILEYIRFVSRIFNVNFVFEEADLQFNVTIVSEEPVSPQNVMSALIQVLRAHNLTILEQENNLLISKSGDINQLPTVITNDVSPEELADAALITRVFRIKNANLNTLVTILKPMVSKAALIETSLETRQLIVTDITTNVEKIAELLMSLDMPHSPLDVDTYTAKNVPIDQLVQLVNQLISPFTEGNPHILVPQSDTNTIFIVSTPYLIEKTLELLADLDTPSEATIAHVATENIFVYKVQHRSMPDLLQALNQIAHALRMQKNPPYKVLTAIEQVKPIPSTNSLLFIADNATIAKLKEVLGNLDTPIGAEGLNFYIYKIQHANEEQIEQSLKQTAENLAASASPDEALIHTIGTMKWIKETNSLVFTGDEKSLQKIKELLPLFDVPPDQSKTGLSQTTLPNQFFIYSPKFLSGPEIEQAVHEITSNLKESGYANPSLIKSLMNVKWIPLTKTLIFTGDSEVLKEVSALLETIDNKSTGEGLMEAGFYLYRLQYVAGDLVVSHLDKIAENLAQAKTPNAVLFAKTIRNIKWIKESNSLLITGPVNAIEYVKQLISQIDVPGGNIPPVRTGATTFVVYKPLYQTGPTLISILEEFEQNLIQSGVNDRPLFDTINNLKWIEKTNSILISGDQPSIQKVQELLQKFDIPSLEGTTPNTIEAIENTNFLIYKLQYHQGGQIQEALRQIATDLAKIGPATNQALLNAVNSLQWIKITNSLIATGDQDVLTKLRSLIENLDIPLRQVFIEVLVIETTLDNSQNFGLQWGGKIQFLTKFAGATNNIPEINPATGSTGANVILPALGKISSTVFPNAVTDLPIAAGTPTFPGFDLGVIGDIIMHKGRSFISLGSLLNALQTDDDSTIVMNPKILTQDNNNSTIFVGQNIPFTSSFVNNQSLSSTVQSVNVEYRDVGVNLSITPILGNADIVTLDITNDISQQTQNTLQSLGLNVTGLQTTHTSMHTRVHVPDKCFLVLSGMIQDTSSHFKSSIPCLGGLPLIGAAFSESDRSRNRKNVIIFVRPQIIDTFDDYKAITEHQEELFREEAFLPSVQEAFEAGIDLVKTPENE